jgi:hypothetical protein
LPIVDRSSSTAFSLLSLSEVPMNTLEFACMALTVLLANSSAKAGESNKTDEFVTDCVNENGGGHLSAGSRVRDILNHPAFAGHGRLILPWDDRAYDEVMRLSNIGSLLPYHSHVDPNVVVGALNRMIDNVNDGKAIFFTFYSEAQSRAEPARKSTGLFFFPGKPGAPFAMIAPGGGFSYVGSIHEGFPYAVEISNKGYNAFVLRYRAGYGGTVATQDLAAAISYIFENAETLGVSTNSYSL